MNKSEYSGKRREFAKKSIDQLMALLASEDLETRFFAEMALRDATST